MATGTYSTKITTATPGANNSAVSALQTATNAANKGVAGYTPIAVDGKYGPQTAAAVAFKAPAPTTASTPAPTIGSTYQQVGGVNPEIANAQNAVDRNNQLLASGGSPVDEQAIRNQTLQSFQAEIDATNALYANKLKEAQVIGANRLGSDTAVQARRGLLGSDFGAARTDTTQNANTSMYGGIENSRASAIEGILSKARQEADSKIANRNTAIAGGLSSHLSYLTGLQTSKEANATKAAQSIYEQNFSPDKLTATELKTAADAYGVKPEDIKNAFLNVQKIGDEAKAKKAAEDAKNKVAGMKVIPTGSILIDANGNVIAKGTPKVSVPKSSVPKSHASITKPVASGKAVFQPADLSTISNGLEQSRDKTTGKVPNDVYNTTQKRWTDLGGLAKDFQSKYPPSKYVKVVPTKTSSDNTIDPATGLPAWLTQ